MYVTQGVFVSEEDLLVVCTSSLWIVDSVVCGLRAADRDLGKEEGKLKGAEQLPGTTCC